MYCRQLEHHPVGADRERPRAIAQDDCPPARNLRLAQQTLDNFVENADMWGWFGVGASATVIDPETLLKLSVRYKQAPGSSNSIKRVRNNDWDDWDLKDNPAVSHGFASCDERSTRRLSCGS